MIPGPDGSGIYHVADDGRHATVTYWTQDSGWTKPGGLICKYDKHNSNVIKTGSHKLGIFEFNVLIKYLEHIGELGADVYQFAQLVETEVKNEC
jgi:hypothetical protein